jgi:transcription-repair coupling factor (superfamily II helicase)
MPQNGVYDLLKLLEIAVDDGYSLGKWTLVNKREIEDLIDRIYAALPVEVQEARLFLKRKEELQNEAQQKANKILQDAQAEADRKLSESDQLKAIEDIDKDLSSEIPMDRLLCGDVGFGKTEVAFRAMFKAIVNNKQVFYLCPTTILSKQQYENALERFKNYPIEIALLNRFTSAKETKRILEGLEKGTIDLVFGTHRLLSGDVKFAKLGLLIVDEEQRFGVTHKEKIKEYKNDVNVLTLSATPIPRTLKMALSGLRDLSIIDTPPTNRYPVQTYVIQENDLIVKDAIYKELSRNGQMFILYNKVASIESKMQQLHKLVPEARITIAHGQMSKKELEDVMEAFINHEYDILLCTTIIETGIDISNANTLIIYDADCFGLSQLYQIRGRVGRSNKIAYCYLMYNKGKQLSDIAMKRLNVIKEFTELGSGFAIATRDLSIRGAGDILGSEQAGFIDSVGIDLYLKMLEEEINKKNNNEI